VVATLHLSPLDSAFSRRAQALVAQARVERRRPAQVQQVQLLLDEAPASAPVAP
jgi:hypothetical protein